MGEWVIACVINVIWYYYDSGPRALRGLSGVATTVRVDARFQGTVVRKRRSPHCRRSPLPDPDGSATSAVSCVRYKLQSKVLRVVSIFLLNNTWPLYECISRRRPVAYTVHRCALRDFPESLSHRSGRLQAFPKTECVPRMRPVI